MHGHYVNSSSPKKKPKMCRFVSDETGAQNQRQENYSTACRFKTKFSRFLVNEFDDKQPNLRIPRIRMKEHLQISWSSRAFSFLGKKVITDRAHPSFLVSFWRANRPQLSPDSNTTSFLESRFWILSSWPCAFYQLRLISLSSLPWSIRYLTDSVSLFARTRWFSSDLVFKLKMDEVKISIHILSKLYI